MRSWVATTAAVAAATLLSALGCTEAVAPPPTSDLHQSFLREAAACVRAEVVAAHGALAVLAAATQTASSEPAAEGPRSEAKAAWHAAMDRWQRLEALQVGPAVAPPAGRGYRDEIYSWPLTGRCMVEQQLVSRRYLEADFDRTLVTGRGLDALEYLLFFEGADNACPPTNVINSGGGWASLDDAERVERRSAYAARVAKDVASTADQLLAAWAEGGEGFGAALIASGGPGGAFRSQREAINALLGAVFYLEKEVKDAKLARPLGLANCQASTCPDALESLHAGASLRHVRNNLVGGGSLLVGCGGAVAGLGFDDLLEASGAREVADRLRGAHEAALREAEAVAALSFREALANDHSAPLELHRAVKGITDILKLELAVILGLDLPSNVAGDND